MYVRSLSLLAAATLMMVGSNGQSTPTSTVASTTVPLPPGMTLAPTHAPFPTANILALPSQFSDIPASAISCWDAHGNYSTTSAFLSSQIWSAVQSSESVYPSDHFFYHTWLNGQVNCSTSFIPTLTTLCDGYPRASTIFSTCQTTAETISSSFYATDYWFSPTWSTELDQLPSPTCKPASDFGPVCSRLKDAYSWRVTHLQSEVPSATGSIATPGCTVLNPTGAVPKCYLEGGSWEAYYWPTPTTGLCGTNSTITTATPTMATRNVTAVVSGFTLTSPSVYHFLRNATLQTFIGRISGIGDSDSSGTDGFAPATTASLLTVKQLEPEILTLWRGCGGSGKRRRCTYHASSDYFSISDLATVRIEEFCRPYGCFSSQTVFQDEYTPTAALAMTDIVAQNQVFAECEWTTPGRKVLTAGPAAWKGPTMKQSDWHKITATSQDVQATAEPGQRRIKT
ncbi:hypothetical protein DE146DRAFT_62309 [Phaeosphaeria sp. MPI-PUGE-AT-0046c]|nr:hypothetical protein DE146DRAFT_62309 [Phaeosphaeria sp. MPI-PUGE-AT-0046c]